MGADEEGFLWSSGGRRKKIWLDREKWFWDRGVNIYACNFLNTSPSEPTPPIPPYAFIPKLLAHPHFYVHYQWVLVMMIFQCLSRQIYGKYCYLVLLPHKQSSLQLIALYMHFLDLVLYCRALATQIPHQFESTFLISCLTNLDSALAVAILIKHFKKVDLLLMQ